jgi:hypothetical protein
MVDHKEKWHDRMTMYIIYTPGGEIPLSAPAEVVRLLRRYPFSLEADFFTIGRQEIEYLEIFNEAEVFTLAHIAPGADHSVPVGEGLPYKTIEQIVLAFLRADPAWKALAHAGQTAVPDAVQVEPAEPTGGTSSAAKFENAGRDAFHHTAPPIEPQAYGCAPLPLLLLMTGLALLAALAVMVLKQM